MRDKPNYCYTSGCPLADLSKGFGLDWGDPVKARLCLHLEALGKDEIVYDLMRHKTGRELIWEKENELNRAEYQRRLDRFPDLRTEPKFVKQGSALVGMSWLLTRSWLLDKFGLERKDLYITNVLRCFPPKAKSDQHYPTGKVREQAEEACRHWDQLETFIKSAPKKEVIAVVSMHPAALAREATPLRLVLENFRKVKAHLDRGGKAIILLGGKAVKLRLGYFDTVTKTQGHYEWLKA